MGFGQFIYATNYSQEGLISVGYLGPLPLICIILFKCFEAIKKKLQTGKVIDYKTSNIFYEDGSIKWINLIPLASNWYGNTAHMVFFAIAFRYAKLGGLN